MTKLSDLKPNPKNPRKLTNEKKDMLTKSMHEFGDLGCIIFNTLDGTLRGGTQRTSIIPADSKIEIEMKYKKPTQAGTVAEGSISLNGEKFKYREVAWDETKAAAAMIAANKHSGDFDDEKLKDILMQLEAENYDLDLTGHTKDEISDLLADDPENTPHGSLSTNFIAPPFSVLDTRQAYWRDRKQYWLRKGIKSELGRSAAVGGSKMIANYKNGVRQTGLVTESDTSIFDPVLCEIAYTWFTHAGDIVLDPFAGGSVRGIVAAELGRHYHGCDLRKEQIKENTKQAEKICQQAVPIWKAGDSRSIDKHYKGLAADFLFSCPPYMDLEVYSDDLKDLSAMPDNKFLEAYAEIITKSVAMLKNDRFAVFVVGEVRQKTKGGFYRNFVLETIKAFESAGARYYNDIILLNAVGSLALRSGKQFKASRKVGKMHQNVLVFCKGDPKKATEHCGTVEVMEIVEESTEQN